MSYLVLNSEGVMDFLHSFLVPESVPIIVGVIIALQIFFFIKNVFRMLEYKEIFGNERSWDINHDSETKFVIGISGEGNKVFESIKSSINEYLKNNSGSVIDFSLLKDAVDRHCDSVENDINTLTPTPLYCGLAGTMAGVIVGLSALITTGSITDLLSSDSGNFGSAARGVNDLLSGVAWAMVASIMGILFTTIASLLFKRYKLQGESGKNTFLAWLQAKLLPELPSDISDALNRLVKNLNKFNNTFAENTSSLRGALREVNESYRIQGSIIKAVHDMDVMKMAKANVRVLEELKECTDKLEVFNQYLNDIHGYTDAIHVFTSQFEQETNRLHVLEEIQQYFMRHKAEIAKDSADADVALRGALQTLKESASSNINELNSIFVQQAEEFKKIIREEKEAFEVFCHEIGGQLMDTFSFVKESAGSNTNELHSAFVQQAEEFKKVIQEEIDTFKIINNEIRAQFSEQLSQIPMLGRRLAEISEIPTKLDRLIERIEDSNKKLALQFSSTMETAMNHVPNGKSDPPFVPPVFQKWMKWIIIISIILIALACISNTVYNIWFAPLNISQVPATTEKVIGTNTVSTHTVLPVTIPSQQNKDTLSSATAQQKDSISNHKE